MKFNKISSGFYRITYGLMLCFFYFGNINRENINEVIVYGVVFLSFINAYGICLLLEKMDNNNA